MQAFKKSLVLFSIFGLLFAGSALAEETINTTPAQPKRTKENVQITQTGFCTKATNVKSQVSNKLTTLEKIRTEKKQDITTELKERKEKVNDQTQQKRDEIKSKLEEKTDELLESSELTDAQRSALETFRESVKQAMETRRAAVDAAQEAYRSAVEELVSARQTAIQNATAAYRTSVSSATTKASSDCSAGSDPTLTRQTLAVTLQAAKEKMQSDLKAVERVGEQVKALAKTRNEAIRTANQAFKAAMQQAREILKTSFPQPETTTENASE